MSSNNRRKMAARAFQRDNPGTSYMAALDAVGVDRGRSADERQVQNVLTEVGDLLSKFDEVTAAFDAGGVLATAMVEASLAAAFRFHPGISASFDADGLPAGLVVDHELTSTLSDAELAAAITDVVRKTEEMVLTAYQLALDDQFGSLFGDPQAGQPDQAAPATPAVTEASRAGTLAVTVGEDGNLLQCRVVSPGRDHQRDNAVLGDRIGKLHRAAALRALHDKIVNSYGPDAGPLLPAVARPAAITAYRDAVLRF